jgi:hypothetical protein
VTANWDRRSPDEQARVRRSLLRGWVPALASFSPFWSDRLRRARVDPARVASLEDLRQVPAVRELDVLGAGGPGSPALLLRPSEDEVTSRAAFSTVRDVARGIRGGGASGKRQALLAEYKPIHLHRAGRHGGVAIAYSRRDLDRLHRAGARAAAVLGLTDVDYLVSAVPAGPGLDFWGTYHLALGASLLAVQGRGPGDGLETAAQAFRLVPATAVAVPAGEAVDLAEAVARVGVDAGRVRTVVTVGVPPTPAVRARVAAAWEAAGAAAGVRVLAVWAPPVARSLWAECAPSSPDAAAVGLHTYPDLEVVELLDPATGRATEQGGDLTYTSAGWHGTGLLRYQTGDYAAGLTAGPCPACGRTVPRVLPDVVPAAWQPAVRLPSGPARLDLRGAAAVLTVDPAVEAWRLEVQAGGPADGEGYAVFVAGELDARRLADLDHRLAGGVGHPPRQLAVEDAEEIRAAVADVGSLFADVR